MTNDLNQKDDSFTLVKSHRKQRRKHPNNTRLAAAPQIPHLTQSDADIVDPVKIIR